VASTIHQSLAVGAIAAGAEAKFVVTARDKYGHAISEGGATFLVLASGQGRAELARRVIVIHIQPSFLTVSSGRNDIIRCGEHY
jgi:hypothetical protein